MDTPSGDRCSPGLQNGQSEPKCCHHCAPGNSDSTLKLSDADRDQRPKRREDASTRHTTIGHGSSELKPSGEHKQFPIAECVLLAGGLRPPPLAFATGQSVLDLWITPTRTVLGSWIDHVASLTERPLCVVYGKGVPKPTLPEHAAHAVAIIHELTQYRGPAGVVRDQCIGGDPSDTILVAEAARWLEGDITELLVAHASSGAAVTIATNPDDSPAGLYMLRRATLDLVGERGFIDLKEQWLESVKQAQLPIHVHRLMYPGTRSLRTHRQFLKAAQAATMREAHSVQIAQVA